MEVPRWVWEEGDREGRGVPKGARWLIPALLDQYESQPRLSHVSPYYLYMDLFLQQYRASRERIKTFCMIEMR